MKRQHLILLLVAAGLFLLLLSCGGLVAVYWFAASSPRTLSGPVGVFTSTVSLPADAGAIASVEVVYDPARVAEYLRTRPPAPAHDPLTSPDFPMPTTPEALRALDADRARIEPLLRQRLAGPPALAPEERVAPLLMLARWQDAAALEELARRIDEGDPKQRARVVSRIDAHAGTLGLDLSPFHDRLLALIDDPDARLRTVAIQICGRLGVPGAGERFQAALLTLPGPECGRVCFWLGREGTRPEALEVIVGLAAVTDPVAPDHWVLQGLVEFAGSRDPAIAIRARQALADLLARPLQWQEEPQSALATLARTGGPEARPALQRWLTGSKNSYTRGLALAGLARTEGAGAVAFLLEHLDDPGLKSIVAGEVAARKKGSGDLALARRLKGSLVAADPPATVAAVARALHDIAGPAAAPLAADLLPRVPASVRMELTWAARGWTLDDVVARAQAAGLLDSPDLDTARRKAREDAGGEDPVPVSVLFRVFDAAGILLCFDVEAGEVPVGYDRLLGEFAARSRGRFRPEGVHEDWSGEGSDDGRGDYTVSFVHDGRLYRFVARDQGDWFDVDPVVLAVHRALQDAGRPGRFHLIDSDGQVVWFLFGDPVTIQTLAAEIALPVSGDRDAARRLGQEFERQALDGLGK